MKKENKLVVLIIIVFIVILQFGKIKETVEVGDIDLHIGAGYDFFGDKDGEYYYSVPISTYVTGEEQGTLTHIIYDGKGKTIGETREDRQKILGKKFSFGQEKLYAFGVDFARLGIRTALNIVLKNPLINQYGYCVVVNGTAGEFLNKKIEGAESVTDYIQGMIKGSLTNNFFKEEVTIRDVTLSLNNEGKNVIMPFIDIKENIPQIIGFSVFDKDKLAFSVNVDEARVMNLLRNNKAMGIMSIQQDSEKFASVYGKTSRKVQCKKINNKYYFTINLLFTGDVINNTSYKDIDKDQKNIKKLEKDLEKQIQKDCNNFIEKMQNEYKFDLLQLGYIAASKYGRGTGVNWNEVISNSDININVKVKIDKIGRGNYFIK